MADQRNIQSTESRSIRASALLILVLAALAIAVALLARRSDPNDVDRIESVTGALRDFNLLVISVDTLRADRLGCYGYAAGGTPTIDRLAAEGVRCARVVTPSPLTLPAHASLLTGVNPQRHGARDNALFSVSKDMNTLARIMREHGYSTGAAVSSFVLDRRFGLDQGFEFYADDMTADGKTQAFGFRERRAEATNTHAIRWLEEHDRNRFFLFVHYYDPHFPYAPPEPFAEHYAERPYDGEIAYVDSQIARLLEALDRLEIRQRTLIVLVSDHGEAFGEHGETTHGLLIYDTTLLVPLVLSAPARLPKGVTLHRQVGLIDVMPTLLDLLGRPIPAGLDGVSLLRPAGAPRDLYIETLHPKVMHNWSPLVGIRRDDVKYILAPKPELYDLRNDPNETNNLFAQRTELANRLHAGLRRLAGGDPQMMAAVSGNLPLDEESRQKLAGLGYVMTATAPTTSAVLPDPKDMVGHWTTMEQAETLAGAGRYAEAFALLETLVHHYPQDARATGALAECCLNLGRFEEAVTLFERQASLLPRKAGPLAGAGLAMIQLGKRQEAEAALTASIREDPENPAALFGMGLLAAAGGRETEAIAFLERCVAAGRGSRTAPAYYNLGVLHERAGRSTEARRSFEQSLALDPHYIPAAMALARLLQNEQKADQAIGVLEKALGNRSAPEARLQLGRLLIGSGRTDEAIAQFQRIVKDDPDHAPAHLELGLAFRRHGDVAGSVKCFRRALALDPKDPGVKLHLGVSLAQDGNLEEARTFLEGAVKDAPHWAQARYNLGVLLAMQRELQAAAREFAEAVRLDPADAGARNAFGQVLLELKRPEEALAQFNEALKIDPHFKPARENLNRALTRPSTTRPTPSTANASAR